MLAAASAESRGIRRGAIAEPDAASGCVDAVLKRVHQSAGVDFERVVLSIGGKQVSGVNTQGYLPIYPKGRTITREDVLQVINHSRQVAQTEGFEQVQAIPREFEIDGEGAVHAPIGRTGARIEVVTHVVSADSRHLRDLERIVAGSGKRISQMVLRGLASGLAVLTEDEVQRGAVVVDIGGGATDLAVFRDGSIIHSGSVPVGGQLVTSDISKLLKTSIQEAERLKTTAGSAVVGESSAEDAVEVLQLGQTQARPLQRSVLCEIIESRIKELALMVRDQIGKSGAFGDLPGGIVLTGGGSLLSGIVELFRGVFPQQPVRAGSPSVAGKSEFSGNPSMSAVTGLALFVARSYDDELSPAGAAGDWKESIRTFWSLVSGRA